MLDARSKLLATKPDGQIKDEEAQQIANTLGLSADQIKDPTKVWNALQYTPEGKQKLGITEYEQQMADAENKYNRAIEDANINLNNTKNDLNNNINDVQKQLDRNLSWMEAS